MHQLEQDRRATITATIRAVQKADAVQLKALKKELTTWGDSNLWFSDLIGENHDFVDNLALSISPLDRAKLTTVYALDILCITPESGQAAARKDLESLFEMDKSGTILPQLVTASTELCTITG